MARSVKQVASQLKAAKISGAKRAKNGLRSHGLSPSGNVKLYSTTASRRGKGKRSTMIAVSTRVLKKKV